MIRNLYWDQSAALRIGGELSEYTLIKRGGVRQGCVMSPDLFNIYSEMILRNLENYPGVKINGVNINNIRYADDTVLIADSEENLQRLLDITIEKSEEMGLTLNVKKTECMVISKKAIVPSCNLQSRGQQIKLVKKFKYLGYMITSDGKCLNKRHREENRSSRNVVYQTNVKNLMGRKENQCKRIERGECSKITVENN